MERRLRCRIECAVLLCLVVTACAVPHPKLATPAPLPRPKEDDSDHDRQRQAWIESMHRAAPGVNWREIEKENLHRSLATLAAASQNSANAPATGGDWVQRGPTSQTGRTWVTTVTSDGSTVLVGSGDEGGLFSGTPGSGNWAQRANSFGSGVQKLVIVPGSPETWVAVGSGYGKVSVSTDQGNSWQTPNGLPSAPCGFVATRLLREPGTSRRVYLLVTVPYCVQTPTFTLLRSDDAGLNFIPLMTASFTAAPDMWMDRLSPGPLYLLTDTGFKSSSDDGASFTLLSNLPLGTANDLRLAGSEAGAPSFYALLSDSNQNTTVLFASADGGRTWKNQGSIPDFSRSNGAVTASISIPDTLLFGGVNAYRSTDGGTTFNLVNNWYEYYSDPVNKLHADVRGLDCLLYKGNETFFADTDGGSYISNDLGATFSNVTQFGMINGEYYSTLTSKNDPNLIAAGSQDQGLQQSAPAQLAATGFNQLISGDYGHLTSTAGDHNMLYAAYPGSVMVLDHESPPQSVTSSAFPVARNRSWMPFILADPTNGNAVYLTGDPLFRASLDSAGWHWTSMPQDFSANSGDYLTALGISHVDQNYWYAASAQGRLWYSHNRGATWTLSSSLGPAAHYFYGTALLPSTTSSTTCFVGGSGYSGPAVYKTTDGGVTWQEMGEGLPSTLVLGLAFDDPSSQNLYAAADAGAFVFDPASAAWKSLVAKNAPIQSYWSVEGIPAQSAVRFGTYGKGIWDYRPQPAGTHFYTLRPCRVIDTRGATSSLAGPALQPNANRVFAMAGACGLPSTARAASVNVTVIGGNASGYLTLGPSDQSRPATSTINYGAGAIRANNAIIDLSTDGAGGVLVLNGSTGSVQFILDLNGYFQ
jgi:photosystem II stability/assembly factor-like uncharacterized protein